LKEAKENMNKVVLEGRNPDLLLQNGGENISLPKWCASLFKSFEQAAELLDLANDTSRYTQAVNVEAEKVADPALTPSGKLLATLLESDKDNGVLGLELAQAYQAEMKSFEYTDTDAAGFAAQADVSFAAQKEIEAADVKDFDTFIRDYFAEAPEKKNA
ncbi:MAG: glutamate--cysteine ligase, partial [Alteromonas macleodii]|nr:glutamate--cysteine ligase [Alteromonas macleodii]